MLNIHYIIISVSSFVCVLYSVVICLKHFIYFKYIGILFGGVLFCGELPIYNLLDSILKQIPSGELKLQLKGHYSLVYDLSWSKKDTHLVSASSDGTVRLVHMTGCF